MSVSAVEMLSITELSIEVTVQIDTRVGNLSLTSMSTVCESTVVNIWNSNCAYLIHSKQLCFNLILAKWSLAADAMAHISQPPHRDPHKWSLEQCSCNGLYSPPRPPDPQVVPWAPSMSSLVVAAHDQLWPFICAHQMWSELANLSYRNNWRKIQECSNAASLPLLSVYGLTFSIL